MSRLKWLFLITLRYYRNLGLRVCFYALLSLVAAIASPLVQGQLSDKITSMLDFGSVMPVLSILATSMLAVSTFSLNIMVSAHRAAASSTTPRVQRILLEDTTTQSVLATFIGAFVYSLASIIFYQAKFYNEETAVVVMGVTIVVVVLVVVSMLRWINHLTNLGSVDNSLDAVYLRVKETLKELAHAPTFGATRITGETVMPTQVQPVHASESGYIQLIDVPGLQECLPEQGAIYIQCRPGTHVLQGQVIAQLTGRTSSGAQADISKFFTIGDKRTFEQDATYGMVVLSEIACKALSSGINDSGTAIATLHALKSLLWAYARAAKDTSPRSASRVFLRGLDHNDFLEAAFAPIARDGAGTIEVAAHLRRTLAELAQSGDPAMDQAARTMATRALEYAEQANLLDREKESLRQIDV